MIIKNGCYIFSEFEQIIDIYAYFLVWTPKNVYIINMIGWSTTTTMEHVEEYTAKLAGLVDGIIATFERDPEGDLTLLEKLQKFRS